VQPSRNGRAACAGRLADDLARRLQLMVGFRNVAVHDFVLAPQEGRVAGEVRDGAAAEELSWSPVGLALADARVPAREQDPGQFPRIDPPALSDLDGLPWKQGRGLRIGPQIREQPLVARLLVVEGDRPG